MPVGNITPPDTIHPIAGIDIGVAAVGVRYKDRDDLVVFKLGKSSQTVAVTTQNTFCAAPVQVLREHIKSDRPQYLIINTGNANAATGAKGREDAVRVCEALAQIATNQDSDFAYTNTQSILPFSTGVIGEPLNTDAIISGLPKAVANFSEDNWLRAANGIRTTDIVPKIASEKVVGTSINGNPINYHITGIAKGSGMIHPNMATMLGFVATDAHIEVSLLRKMLISLNETSFNRITVDGDTSTNDCLSLLFTIAIG